MAAQISWLVPNHVILVKFDSVVTKEATFNAQIVALMNTSNADAVHIVIDGSTMNRTPLSIRDISKGMTFPRHPLFGWLIAVGFTNPVMRMVGRILSTVFGVRTREFTTVEQALFYLRTVDATIPTEQAAEDTTVAQS